YPLINNGELKAKLSVGAQERLARIAEKSAKAEVNTNIYSSRDDELEARLVADKVVSLQTGDSSGDKVAILVRSRTHLSKIIEELKAREIDFRTTKLDPLGECAVVQDLMSLTRALMHPFDRVAWLSILRAPWCGLSLKDIHLLTHTNIKGPVYPLINNGELKAKLSVGAQERLPRIAEKIAKAQKLRGKVDFALLLESLWVELGGPACLSDASEMEDAQAFFELLRKFLESGVPFSVSALETRAKDLFATHDGTTKNPVEIMTIYKAKGLEFDHVILPGLGRVPRSDDNELLTWIEKDGDMLLAPVESLEIRKTNSLYDYIRHLKTEKLRLELTRLFYVACTRAKLTLNLYAHVKSVVEGIDGAEATVNVASRSLLSTIEGSLDAANITEVAGGSAKSDLLAREARPVKIELKRLKSSWKLPEPAPALERGEFALMPNVVEERESRPAFDWATEERKHIGTVLHRYFCRIVVKGIESWDEKLVDSEELSMRAMLRGLGLSKEKAKAGARESVNTLKAALADEQGRFVLSAHSEDEAEYQLTGIVDGVVKDVKIDRTFVDSEGVRWIIDYKTGSHKGDIKTFLENEKIRYSPQLMKYKEIFSAIEKEREIKCALYYPALGTLEEL
ncbi:MAG: PD-(D/E)XK nuclease family protein, partial [Proteobacteria bacterium]|nr:PD-(D/E)XK nuclease family protein [Pseudomonadota bacterium]